MIEVARPILLHAKNLSDTTLLEVIAEKGQEHLIAVTQRPTISGVVSHALVEKGDDHVVSLLLNNLVAGMVLVRPSIAKTPIFSPRGANVETMDAGRKYDSARAR